MVDLTKRPLSNIAKVWPTLAAILLLAVIAGMRFHHLGADPPPGLSISTDVYTDPPQYTLSAKQQRLTGDFNPYNDYRFVFFVKSTVTALAYFIFHLSGVSITGSHFAGFLYSFGALVCFYFISRKLASTLGGLFFILLIATDYNQLFFGKLPFLEHAMSFYGALAVVLALYYPHRTGHLLCGISLAIGIFFGKILGLIFLFPFSIFFVYRLRFEKDTYARSLPLYTIAGFAVVAAFWLFFSYLPMQQQVTSYVGEQAFSLYGAPEGLQSIEGFIRKFVSFGEDTKLFKRMRFPALLGLIFLGLLFYRACFRESWTKGFGDLKAGHWFIAAMIVGFYGALMIWNYRPLRYQLVLIYPFYTGAAIVLHKLWQKPEQQPSTRPTPILFLPLLFILALPLFYQVYAAIVDASPVAVGQSSTSVFWEDYRYQAFFGALILSVIVFLLVRLYNRGVLPRTVLVARAAVILIIGLVCLKGWLDYDYWLTRPSFTSRDNSRDLSMILSPEAVVSGPYAGLLTLENKLGTVIHMFGVSEYDPDFFNKFPITHLALDEANEERAREDYALLMDSAVHLITYHIAQQKVRILRIAGHSGNAVARQYTLSQFEQLNEGYKSGLGRVDNQLAVDYLSQYPENISCYSLLAEAAEADKIYQLAEAMFKKAVEFSPTNYNLNARLAKFYQDRFKESGNKQFRELGLHYYSEALRFAPTVRSIQKAYDEL